MSKRLGVLFLAALIFAACQRTAPSLPVEGGRVNVAALRAEGDARFAARDYAAAIEAYRQVLIYTPDVLPARYALGVALAHLDRTDEAITAFTWVTDHALPTSDEFRLARQWLVDAGVLSAPASVAAPINGSDAPPPAVTGVLQGATGWNDLEPGRPRPAAQILLDGDEQATRGRRYWARVPLGDAYEVAGVAPGRYRLLVQVGPVRLWDTTALVEPSRVTRLDLTPSNAIARPDALRPAS